MRRIIVFIAACGAIALLLLIICFTRFDVSRYRGRVQSALEQQLNRKVVMGRMTLTLVPFHLRVENPVIEEDPRFGGRFPFIKADTLEVSAKLLPLFAGNVEIYSATLNRPRIEVVKNSQGVWNLASLALGNAKNPAAGNMNITELAKISIRDGQIAVTNQEKRGPRTVYDHLDLTLGDFGSGKTFTVEGTAHVSSPGSQELRLQGKAAAIWEGRNASFNGTVSLKRVEIGGLRNFFDTSVFANMNGIVSGETKINAENGKLDAVGSIRLENARINSLDVIDPITAHYDLNGDLGTDILKISSATIQLRSMAVSVIGFVNMKPTTSELDLHVRSSRVTSAEITHIVSAFGIALPKGTDVTGLINCDVQIRGPANNPVPTGTIAGRDLRIVSKDLPQSVQIKSVDLELIPSEIRTNNFAIASGNTTIFTRIVLTQYSSNSPSIDLVVRAANASLPEMRAIAKTYGAKWAEKIGGSGTINFSMRASGRLNLIHSPKIIGLLNGNADFNLSNVRVSGIDVEHELANIGGFLKSDRRSQGFTNIERLTAHFVVKNGIAQTSDLRAALKMGTVAANGTTNLESKALNFRAIAVLSKAASDKVGGKSLSGHMVGGYMRTTMSNKQGELVIPGTVTGTFENPKFNPDAEQLARMRMKGIIPSSDNPAGALGYVPGSKGIEKTLGGILRGRKK
jgi:uncharacterized protein involved in outer membrane biogenesis